jgi:hypothetical protein
LIFIHKIIQLSSHLAFHNIGAADCIHLRKGKERGRNEGSMKERGKGERDKDMTEGRTEEKTNEIKRNTVRRKERNEP